MNQIANLPNNYPGLPQPAVKSKAKLIIWLSVISGLVLIVLAIVAYIFYVHIPNKPENVYRRGLGSVGAGMQYLITPELLDDSQYSV